LADQEPKSRTTKSSRAAVPPPLVFLGALVIGVILNIVRPLPIFSDGQIGDVLGLLVTIASAALAFWAFRTMLRAGEQPDPAVPTKSIVRQGPFARTRNPLYLSFAIFDLGVGLLLNNLWIVIALVPLVLYVDRGIIRREERSLEQQFDQEYLDYKASVRRWI
jgi:protein-S-isoprenylcysteine O-methyltransferase Ste14